MRSDDDGADPFDVGLGAAPLVGQPVRLLHGVGELGVAEPAEHLGGVQRPEDLGQALLEVRGARRARVPPL